MTADPMTADPKTSKRTHVGLFATCLVDAMRPSVGFAAARLLERAGCKVSVPPAQTCCGQPAYNAGDGANARAIAAAVVTQFEGFDYVVAPSASCAGMLRRHYPALLIDDAQMALRARALADKCWELVSFLTDVMKVETVPAARTGVVAYHDSCSALREMSVAEQPRRLLNRVAGLQLAEIADPDACCGFGGTFCVKYPEISDHMLSAKVRTIESSGADLVVGVDLGCLINIAGKLSRLCSSVRVRHVAEILAGPAEGAAIGEPPYG